MGEGGGGACRIGGQEQQEEGEGGLGPEGGAVGTRGGSCGVRCHCASPTGLLYKTRPGNSSKSNTKCAYILLSRVNHYLAWPIASVIHYRQWTLS